MYLDRVAGGFQSHDGAPTGVPRLCWGSRWSLRGFTIRVRRLVGQSLNSEARSELALSLATGAVVGLAIVAFILLTGRLAAQMYPPESAAWRRLLIPLAGALVGGILLYRWFPEARGSGIPQTKFAIFIRDGYISLRTVVGKFLCCTASLASGIALAAKARRRISVQASHRCSRAASGSGRSV